MSNNPNFSHSNSESFQDQDVLNDSEIPPFDPDAAIARREAVLQQEQQTESTIGSTYQSQINRPDRKVTSVGEHSAILADLDGHTKGIESEYFNLGFDRAECLQDNPELKSAITDFIFEVAKVDGTRGASFDKADTAPIKSLVKLLQLADRSNPAQQEVVRDMFSTLTSMGGALTLIRNETRRHPEITEKLQQEDNQIQTPEESQQEETPEEQAEREWRVRRIESLVAAIEDQIKSTERRADDAKQDLQHLQAMIEEELSARDKADTNMLRSYNRRYSDYNDELNLVSRRLNELADDLLAACSHGREDLEPQRFEDLRRRGFSLLDQSEEVKKSSRQNLDYFDDTSRRIRQLEQLLHGW